MVIQASKIRVVWKFTLFNLTFSIECSVPQASFEKFIFKSWNAAELNCYSLLSLLPGWMVIFVLLGNFKKEWLTLTSPFHIEIWLSYIGKQETDKYQSHLYSFFTKFGSKLKKKYFKYSPPHICTVLYTLQKQYICLFSFISKST